MMPAGYYERALAIDGETVANRRFLHRNAEVGLDLPITKAFVKERLEAYGLSPRDCGHGVTAVIGHAGEGRRTLLLRADMDALPIAEESGEPFACPSGAACHACGHDFHAAMLLSAARLLKEDEAELGGAVKLMFQPGEECFAGARDMLAAGIMENPPVDAALAFHVMPGRVPVGRFQYSDEGMAMYSADGFRVVVMGVGSHGAFPHTGVDPINIACHIHLALQALIARESDPEQACVLTVGSLQAGSAPNVIPDSAVLQGTIRTNDAAARGRLVRRVREVCEHTAAAFGGTAEVEVLSAVPPLRCDGTFVRELVGYLGELPVAGLRGEPGLHSSGSEDFALVAERVPSAFMYLWAGFPDDRGDYPVHHPKVRFNEDVCPIGVAALAHCAARWLRSPVL